MKLGLVLEGGGMRGIYTVGVLDSFLDHHVEADYVIGVSAGASNGVSYLSRQRGRGYHVNLDFIKDRRYISFSNYLKTKSVFGMDFIFQEIPHNLIPFDYDTFYASADKFVVGTTDVSTGNAVYFTGEDLRDYDMTVLRASCSLPVFSPMVPYRNGLYLDGGISDPIPVKKAIEDGCDKIIAVLTRERGYQKTPESFRAVYHAKFRKYPGLVEAMDRRHTVYNDTLRFLEELEREGRALVIAPSSPLGLSRFEKDRTRMEAAYQAGMRDADALLPLLNGWCPLASGNPV